MYTQTKGDFVDATSLALSRLGKEQQAETAAGRPPSTSAICSAVLDAVKASVGPEAWRTRGFKWPPGGLLTVVLHGVVTPYRSAEYVEDVVRQVLIGRLAIKEIVLHEYGIVIRVDQSRRAV